MKKKEQIFEQVKSVLVERIGVEPESIQMGSKMNDDLGLDSLDRVELTIELEREFDVTITDDEFESLVTIKDIVKYLKSKIK